MKWIEKEITKVGRLLFEEHLVSARAGNLSISFCEQLYITRTGSNLGSLSAEDIIRLPLKSRTILDDRASVELEIHREIILRTGKKAVVHAHPPATVMVSLESNTLELPDYEGSLLLGKIPVIDQEKSISLKERIADILSEGKVVILRRHGVFSADDSLYQAYSHISVLEHSCQFILEINRRSEKWKKKRKFTGVV